MYRFPDECKRTTSSLVFLALHYNFVRFALSFVFVLIRFLNKN